MLRAKLLYGGAAEFKLEKPKPYPRSRGSWNDLSKTSTTFSMFPGRENDKIAESQPTIKYLGADIEKLIEMFDDNRI